MASVECINQYIFFIYKAFLVYKTTQSYCPLHFIYLVRRYILTTVNKNLFLYNHSQSVSPYKTLTDVKINTGEFKANKVNILSNNNFCVDETFKHLVVTWMICTTFYILFHIISIFIIICVCSS